MLYLEELASLYGALHQYDAVAKEYIKLVRANAQQVTYVQGRLSSFTGRREAQQAALAVVQQEVARSPEEAPLRSLLGWLHMEGKEYESALEEYRHIDRITKAQGSEIFRFAQRASQEHAHAVSARAFREVVEQSARKELVPYARFGYARAIEELSVESDSMAQNPAAAMWETPTNSSSSGAPETQPTFQGALGLYEKIVRDYPNSEICMQALYQIGTIRFDRFFDLDGALAAFNAVRVLPHNAKLVYEATSNVAEVLTARNDLAGARREYEQLLKVAPGEHRDKILYRLAELDYFEARFDSAVSVLQRISTNMENDITNDALQLLYFVQENRVAGQEALAQFGHGDLMMRQRKYSEALLLFGSVGARFAGTAIADDSYMRIGELHLSLNRVDSAIAVFRTIIKDMPSSVLRDRAQMRIGEVYQVKLKNKAKAIEAYETLLATFPSSLLVEEARKRIRMLRGDSL
jgi:tetratricopeptide (TPR) repeat protein